jgi:hypothetical protein
MWTYGIAPPRRAAAPRRASPALVHSCQLRNSHSAGMGKDCEYFDPVTRTDERAIKKARLKFSCNLIIQLIVNDIAHRGFGREGDCSTSFMHDQSSITAHEKN